MKWFNDVTSSRNWNEDTPLKLPYAEYHAWIVCTGVRVTRREIAILRAMDRAYCDALVAERAAILARIEDEKDTQ